MSDRRPLEFTRLDEVMPDVDRLLLGHETVGNWSLGQICNHLSNSLRYSIEGFPRRAPWIFRKLVGPIARRFLFNSRRMPEGLKAPARYVPVSGLDDRAEVEALRAALRFYSGRTSPFPEHPLFGWISDADWDTFHRIHFAHHLSFVLPRSEAAAENDARLAESGAALTRT